MLSENDLAALSMSRTPVRAALTRLLDEGWVTIYPQRGALVRAMSDEEMRESAQVRHALESAGIQRSRTVRREQLAVRLAEKVDEQQRALAASFRRSDEGVGVTRWRRSAPSHSSPGQDRAELRAVEPVS